MSNVLDTERILADSDLTIAYAAWRDAEPASPGAEPRSLIDAIPIAAELAHARGLRAVVDLAIRTYAALTADESHATGPRHVLMMDGGGAVYCNDGTIWAKRQDGESIKWIQIDSIPQP